MVVIVKKTGMLAICIIAVCVILIGIMAKSAPNVCSQVVVSKSSTIVIDAGHGGIDGGAQSPNGACEKDYNLAVARELQALFQKAHIKTVMTRSQDDINLSPLKTQTPLARKRADLDYRKTLPQKTKADLLITIHMNKFQNTSAHGAQVFYDSKFPVSQSIASCIQKNLIHDLDPDNTRQIKPAEKSIYLFKSPYVPTVLVECGFLSNAKEEAKLREPRYRKKLAQCIFSGVMDYLSQKANQKNAKKTTVCFSPLIG